MLFFLFDLFRQYGKQLICANYCSVISSSMTFKFPMPHIFFILIDENYVSFTTEVAETEKSWMIRHEDLTMTNVIGKGAFGTGKYIMHLTYSIFLCFDLYSMQFGRVSGWTQLWQ